MDLYGWLASAFLGYCRKLMRLCQPDDRSGDMPRIPIRSLGCARLLLGTDTL